MSEWFDSYMKRLDKIASVGGGPSESGTDIAQRVLNSGLPANYNAPSAKKGNDNFWNSGASAGSILKSLASPITAILNPRGTFAALDLLGRPNYAVANPFTQAAKQGKHVSFDFINNNGEGNTSIGEDLRAMLEGFAGREKNTFGDALREAGYGRMGRIPGTPITGRGALGFGFDAALDPLNLIPGSAIARGVSKTSRALGHGARPIVSGVDDVIPGNIPFVPRDAPRINGDVNLPQGTQNLAPPVGEPVPGMAAPPGADSVAPALPSRRPGPNPPAGLPGREILDRIAALTPDEGIIPPRNVPDQPGLFDLKQFADESMLATAESMLKRVPTDRTPYPYFKDDVQTGTREIFEEVPQFKDVNEGGIDPSEFIAQNLMQTRMAQADPKATALLFPEFPADYKGTVPKSFKSKRGTEVMTRADAAAWVAAAKKPDVKKFRENIVAQALSRSAGAKSQFAVKNKSKLDITLKNPSNGMDHHLTFEDIMDDINSGEPVENTNVIAGTNIPYSKFVADMQGKIQQLPKGEVKRVQTGVKKVKTGEEPIFQRSRLKDDLEREAWKGNMRLAGFSDKEINALIRNANLSEQKYDALLERMLGMPFNRAYTIDEFIREVKVGRLSDKSPYVKRMYELLGVRGIKSFENKINKLRQSAQAFDDAAQGVSFDSSGQGLMFELSRGQAKAKKAKVSAKSKADAGPADPDSPWLDIQVEAHMKPKAEDIVEEAAVVHGDAAVNEVLDALNISLTPAQAHTVENALQNAGIKQFGDKSKWPFKTNRNVDRTSKTPGEGYARYPAWTRHAQYTLHKAITNQLNQNIKGWSVNDFMTSLKASEEVIKARGINPILADGFRGTPLSAHDVYELMGPEFVQNFVLHKGQGVFPTSILEAVDELVDAAVKGGVTETELRARLMDIVKKPIKQTVKENGKPVRIKQADGTYKNKVRIVKPGIVEAAEATGDPNTYIRLTVVNPLIKRTPEFVARAEQNLAALNLKTGQLTKRISNEVIHKFLTDLETGEVAKTIQKMATVKQGAKEAVKDAGFRHVGGLDQLVTEQVELGLDDIGATLSAAAKAADEMLGAPPATIKAVNQAFHNDMMKSFDLATFVDELAETPVWDISQNLTWRLDSTIIRRLAPHLGNKNLRPVMLGQRVGGLANAARFTAGLSDISRRYPNEEIIAAFNFIRTHADVSQGDELVQTLNTQIKQFLDPHNPKYDALQRNGVFVHEINRQLDHFGMPKDLRFKESLDEWKTWDIKDPLDFLAKMHTSAQQVFAYQAVGGEFSRVFGSAKKLPGYVKIVNNGGDSVIYNYIDPKMYFPKEIAKEMTVMDEFLVNASKPANRTALMRFFDTALYKFKAGYTIYRVGHHMRNAMGDAWFNYMDGVTNPKYYTDAIHMLSTGKGRYGDFDFTAALQEPTATAFGVNKHNTFMNPNKVVATVRVNGRKIRVTGAQAYRYSHQHGGLPDHSIIEDLRFEDTAVGGNNADIPVSDAAASRREKLFNRASRPFGGRVRQVAVKTSEVRDHYFRASHFLHALENTKVPKHLANASDDDILNYLSEVAAQRVRKFHPDGSDMTLFESNVMRRGITFYAWMRKAIPLVIEQMVLRPGRFMVYPKAMHSMAQGMGIDLEGYGDPFPQDQLFPSFMRDSVQGPVFGSARTSYGTGGYWGLRLGNPGMDVIDDFLYSPKNLADTVAQSTNPFFRVPGELLAGSKWGTQVPIQDKSDYIGQQIPNMGYADKISNKLFDRTVSSGFTDDLYEAKSNEGYRPDVGNVGIINWLLGIGLTDMSKPSHIKTAEREMGER